MPPNEAAFDQGCPPVTSAEALSPKAQLVRTEKKGRLFVARERIEAGELVVLDRNGAMVPETRRMDSTCMRCCAPAVSSLAEACDECRFPYCSLACKREDAGVHAVECDLPPFLLDIAEDEAVDYQYLWLAARVVIASHGQGGESLLKGILAMETHRSLQPPATLARWTRAARRLLGKLPPPAAAAASAQDVVDLFCAFKTNAYGFRGDALVNEISGVAIFPLLGIFPHSCLPNCHFLASRGAIEVRTVRAVEAGEELSLYYVDLWKPTAERQAWLRATKFFTCECPRCCTPDEGGRFLSGVRCSREACAGYACPEGEEGLWRCAACGQRGGEPEGRPWDEVAAGVDEGLRMHALGCTAEGLAAVRAALASPAAARLHPNHAAFSEARFWLRARCLDAGDYAGATAITRQVLATARAVLPEHHTETAALLHALGAQLRRQARQAGRREGGGAEAAALLRESVDAFRECAGSLLVLEGAAGRALAAVRPRLEEAEEDLAGAEAGAEEDACN